MSPEKWILLAVNVLGGSAVIGSYVHGVLTHPGRVKELWGGVPHGFINFYTLSMLLAAAGYFCFVYFILFRLNPGDTLLNGGLNYNTFSCIFALILIPSALWMPLTVAMLANPAAGLWIAIRVTLALVGLGALAMIAALLLLDNHSKDLSYWLALAGSVFFAIQTSVLDALVWPSYWPL
jgi:hypothetical protein